MMVDTIALSREELAEFGTALRQRKEQVYALLADEKYRRMLQPAEIYEGAALYLQRTGKALRPVYLLWCAGATGGAEREMLGLLPAAAVETYHTWGLVHDDIIDMDDMRRGGPTVHKLFEARALAEKGYSAEDATRFGVAMAILAGDALMAWTMALLTELYDVAEVDPALPRYFIREISQRQIPTLIDGEITDVMLEKADVRQIDTQALLEMSYKKTGSIFAFAGAMGAMIGLNRADPEHPYVVALDGFAHKSGLAFQLIDDVINIAGSPETIGKPVGSDIVIGKRTLPILHALRHARGSDEAALRTVFGNAEATQEQIEAAIEAVKRSGGLDTTREIAFGMVREAFDHLAVVPQGPYHRLIELLGRRLVDRQI